jgi:hypothetical protein
MMLGFGGINYTVWLYMSWMPNYLEAERHLSVSRQLERPRSFRFLAALSACSSTA